MAMPSLYEHCDGEEMKENDIKISVVIPMYNGGDKIHNSLSKFDDQKTDVAYEVLIVDDKSSDDSVEKVEAIIAGANHPDRFRLIKCPENGRAGRARNIGIEKAAGEYILFADQDDYPSTDIIEELYKLSDNGRYDIVSCGIGENNGDTYTRPRLDHKNGFPYEEKVKYFGKYGYVFGSLIKRDLLVKNDIRFPEKVMFEDVLFNEGLLACADSIRTTEKTLCFRCGDESSQTFELSVRKLNDRIDAARWYLAHYADNPAMKPYSKWFGFAALFYVYLSSMRWILTNPDLYDEALVEKSIRSAKEIDPDWKIVLRNENRIKKKYLFVLKAIYYRPGLVKIIKDMHSIKRLIRGY